MISSCHLKLPPNQRTICFLRLIRSPITQTCENTWRFPGKTVQSVPVAIGVAVPAPGYPVSLSLRESGLGKRGLPGSALLQDLEENTLSVIFLSEAVSLQTSAWMPPFRNPSDACHCAQDQSQNSESFPSQFLCHKHALLQLLEMPSLRSCRQTVQTLILLPNLLRSLPTSKEASGEALYSPWSKTLWVSLLSPL